ISKRLPSRVRVTNGVPYLSIVSDATKLKFTIHFSARDGNKATRITSRRGLDITKQLPGRVHITDRVPYPAVVSNAAKVKLCGLPNSKHGAVDLAGQALTCINLEQRLTVVEVTAINPQPGNGRIAHTCRRVLICKMDEA